MKSSLVGLVITFALCLAASDVWALDPLYEDTLSNVLREKDIITKEDWVRIEAAKEKKAEEVNYY